ncbi:peptidoglycan glycosyltransferase [Coriobacterium glomerans PW2]|uniref:Peptidoglycan glycosyltransferase n=1 Tax=Coriobacterium glomerans (strain ATCC 49209 / DSM 20642 / JCM 10262 / PW2) TaxID=700015 RepID=F2N7S7_CORGP|nr:penicillin-binding protein 2 [Coriobacterium glomerans]AEB06969.1 peptidoglycan glycosyltransferase [Coriobacterium glomerans PW2]
MDAQLVVIIAAAILVAAIVGSLLFLRGYSGRFTFDTHGGTRPRAAEGEGSTPAVTFKGRFTLLSAGLGAMFCALAAKLWSMQMVSSDYYERKAKSNQTRTVTTPAPRGRILDRNGVPLVSNRASLTVAAYRDLAEDAVVVRHLANVLGMPYVAALRKIQNNSEGAQSRHTIAVDVRRSTIAYIQEHAGEFPGVLIDERTERIYPQGQTAAHVLGYTGTISQEQLKASKDDSASDKISYQSGDIVGQAGVEIQYEGLLQGVRGEQTVTVDAAGNITGQSGSVPAKPGSDIKLTLDLKIQQACEKALANAIELAKRSGQRHAGNGACLCLDCTNGEILGLASEPRFDPSVFIGGISPDVWDELSSKESGTPLLNRAVGGQYMSASTIKVLSSLAGLEYGVYPQGRTTVCTGTWTGNGEANPKHCWLRTGHGTMNLESGLANSCDPVFYDIGKGFYDNKDNPEGLQEVFRRWGLGAKTGVDLPSEGVGRIPDSAWKESYFTSWSDQDRAWNPGDMTNIAIGQGDILVTPLQMAVVYAGVAMGGVEYTPHVLLSAVARDGQGDAFRYNDDGKKERLRAKIHAESNLALVKQGLHDMIYGSSSDVASHFKSLPVEVAGKSGTGEKSNEDDYSWFCAYAPAPDPKYVVVALLEQGGGGSATALRAVRDVLGVIYDSPDGSSAVDNSTR